MNLMGIDLAFSNVGYVIVEPRTFNLIDFGVIRTKREHKKLGISVTQDDIRRVNIIANGLGDLVTEHNIGGVIAEMPTGGARIASSAKTLGMAVGVLVTACNARSIQLHPVTPISVKKGLTGLNNASKNKVAQRVLQKWPVLAEHRPAGTFEHVSDAAAVLLTSKDSNVYRDLYLRAALKEVLNG